MDNVVLGSTLRLNIKIYELEDLDLSDERIEISCVFYTKKPNKITIDKNKMIKTDDGCYQFYLDTTNLTPGILICELKVSYPDDLAENGMVNVLIRKETTINIIL